MRLLLCTCGIVAFIGSTAAAETAKTDKTAETAVAAQSRPEIEIFIGEMVRRHGFKQVELESIFGMAQFQPAIIKAISQPATSRPWREYRPLFVNPRRIAGGVDFWKSHAATLERARKEFGIPEEIITAVIGVETTYGIQTGKHRVLDALMTLAFGYPKRAEFFRNELEQYLLLGREQNADVLNIRGSYA
ncbi:MAG: lytic murein transglycosylase, partial [Nitrosospira sp.]